MTNYERRLVEGATRHIVADATTLTVYIELLLERKLTDDEKTELFGYRVRFGA